MNEAKEATNGGAAGFPRIVPLGLDGLLVRFGDRLDEATNRAALAFRAAVETAGWPGVEEAATSLASVYLRFDPCHADPETLADAARGLLAEGDWYAAPLPQGRRLWRVPVAFGGPRAPELAEAARLAGVTEDRAVAQLTAKPVRVIAIGFAPGQPYLGTLPENWNLPRRSELNPAVPAGALVVAIRQFVLFGRAAPTGWRHVGQTAFRCFRPEDEMPFALRPGDEVLFEAVSAEALARIERDDPGGGGARAEPVR